MTATTKYPAPAENPETKPFWDAARQGKFLIKRCTACNEPHYFPRAICPFCFSDKTEWQDSKGEGVDLQLQLMPRSPTGPYAVGYVTLDEGPSLLTNFVDCDLSTLKIGQRVRWCSSRRTARRCLLHGGRLGKRGQIRSTTTR